jgi:hypothetical protein
VEQIRRGVKVLYEVVARAASEEGRTATK